jgi:hypothetical protein
LNADTAHLITLLIVPAALALFGLTAGIVSADSADIADRLDELIRLSQAAGELPRRRAGKKTSLQTLYRWSNPPGCRGVVLRTIQVGATRCTTRAWLAEFFERLTAARQGAEATTVTPASRRREVERAERELTALGI